MILSLIENGIGGGGFSLPNIAVILLSIPTVLISLCFHEMSHAFIADKLGDPTARCMGRVSMNPVKHLDVVGMLSMLLFGIGWAKPVPINPNNFKNKKAGMALSGLAGPVSNLILAFFGVILLRVTLAVAGSVNITSVGQENLILILYMFFTIFSTMNIYLAIFNLIPVPPFDGSRIFYFVLPEKYYFGVMKYERIIMGITLAMLFLGVLDRPLGYASGFIFDLFNNIVGLVPFL